MSEVVENTEIEPELSTADLVSTALDAVEIDNPETESKETVEAENNEPEYVPRLGGYKGDQKEVLKTLPSNILKMIDDREEHFLEGTKKFKEKSDFGERVKNILAPDTEIMQQLGYTPDTYVAKLTSVERQLRAPDPITRVRALQGIMKDYGIDQ